MIAGVAISLIYANNIEQRVRADLAATMNRVIAAVDPADLVASLNNPLQDPRYDAPFGGLYWQVADIESGEIARSRSLWDYRLVATAENIADGETHYAVIEGPNDQALSSLARTIGFRVGDETRSFLVVVGEDRAELSESVYQFGTDLTVALGIVAILLIGAAALQVQLGLRPLGAIRAGVEKVRGGEARELDDDYPTEVRPLVLEVNDLLRSQEASIDFARARASDLAHGLKTPLSVLATTMTTLRERGDEEMASLVEELVSDMADKIDYQLRLSRVRLRTSNERYRTPVKKTIDRTVSVLKRTLAGEELDWNVEIDPELAVDLDSHDLVELLGVILENASKWGRSAVWVVATAKDGMADIVVEDDGPGLPDDQLQSIGVRGHRADETKSGSGLGLAIAKEIVSLNRGTIAFSRSGKGGLAVHLALPLAHSGGVSRP